MRFNRLFTAMVISISTAVLCAVPSMLWAWGPDTDLSAVSASFWGEDAGDIAGAKVSGAGDVNGDGYDDFLIGAMYDEDGGSNAGQVYLILGKASGWSMDMDLSNADASFWGENAGDYAGLSVSCAGDVNGDGYNDFLIGAYRNNGGGNAGQVYLILGKASGWSMDTDLSLVDASFWGEDADDYASHSVSCAGDVNGDGYDDFLIGAPYDEDGGSNAGQAYLILGKASGWSMDTDLSLVDASFRGEDAGDMAGYLVSGAGDVNGDGYDDFLIGAVGDEDGGGDWAGQVYLILGKAEGWSMDIDLSTVDASFWGEDAGDQAGNPVSSAGDVNGDGYDDFLIGAGLNNEGGSTAGQVYLILGKASGWSMDTDLSSADASFWGEDSGDHAGYVSCAGDVNGDGYDDFLIGAPYDEDGGSNAGQAYLILGKASGWSMDTNLSQANASFIGEDAGDYAGQSVSCAGDVNGDGYDDFLIGAPFDDDGGSDAGQAYLVLSDQTPQVGVAVSLPDTSASPGATLTIPINVSNATDIAGAEITLTYNPAILTATGVQKTTLTSNFILADTLSEGQLKISLASGTGIPSGSGSLVDVTFQVSEDASPGDTTSIVLEQVTLYDELTNPITATTENGLFTVVGPVRIDVSPDTAIVEVGKTQTFTCQGFDAAGNPVEVSPTWSVVPSEIGDISADGLFTAKTWGEGKVIATEEGIADTATVIVGILGDINFDGLVDVRDAIICLRIEAELPLPPLPLHETPTAYEIWAADMNRDEVIEANDALLILYKSLGKPVAKPVPFLAGVKAEVRLADVSESQGLIIVPILVEHRPDVCAADVRLSYDPTLLRPVEVKGGTSDALLISNTRKEGRIIAVLVSTEGLLASDRSLLSVSFEVKGNLAGRSPLQFEKVRLFDASAEPIAVRIGDRFASTESVIPQTYGLSQNFPNPFNASTVIRVQLPQEDRVALRVYNLSGQVVRTLMDDRVRPGAWSVVWDGRDEEGQEVSSGVYLYRLVVEDGRWTDTGKAILLR